MSVHNRIITQQCHREWTFEFTFMFQLREYFQLSIFGCMVENHSLLGATMRPFCFKRILYLFLLVTCLIGAEKRSIDHQLAELPREGLELHPGTTLMNINNWSYWLNNSGESGASISTPFYAMSSYPRGTANTIYRDGLMWGTLVDGVIHTGGQEYAPGTAAITDHVYRIRKDWSELTLGNVRQETAEYFNIDLAEVTDELAGEIIGQYLADWRDWPVDLGAPYIDVNQNGTYDPVRDAALMPDPELGDYPGYRDADMVIWLKVDDSEALAMFSNEPIDLTLEVTVWGYNASHPELADMFFKKYRITNQSQTTYTDMYLSQWSDPDLGYAGDDLVGCDPLLDCAYIYNGSPTDTEFEPFSLSPPAVGYALLQGPVVPSPGDSALFDGEMIWDHKNLPMTAFAYFGNGWEWSDPNNWDPLELYNAMSGFNPWGMYTHATGPEEGEPTLWPLNGDPVLGIGDIDGIEHGPDDRRFMLNSGPFNLAPGESQEMVVGLVGGRGADYLTAVPALKSNIETAREYYGSRSDRLLLSYDLRHPDNLHTELLVNLEIPHFETVTLARIDFSPENGSGEYVPPLTLYDDGAHDDGQAQDGLFAASMVVTNKKFPYAAELVLSDAAGWHAYEGLLTGIRIRPNPRLENWQIVWENRGQDGILNDNELAHVQFDIRNMDGLQSIDEWSITREQTVNFDTGLPPGGAISCAPDYFILNSTGATDSLTIWYRLVYDHHHIYLSDSFPIVPWEQPAAPFTADHEGNSDATVNISILDPQSLTGHRYEVFFNEQEYYRDLDGNWVEIPSSVAKNGLGRRADISLSQLSCGAIYSYVTPGRVNLRFSLNLISDGSWADGIRVDLPPELNITSWTPISGAYASYGTGQGQNVVNSMGTLDAATNSIMWGDSSRSEFGAIEGDINFEVEVETFTPPVTLTFKVYDDGYNTVLDAEGSLELTQIGYETKMEKHWNLQDVTLSEMVLEDQTVLNGVDIYTGEAVGDPIVDGFLISVDGSYELPVGYDMIRIITPEGLVTENPENIQDYNIFGVANAQALSILGFGSTDTVELGYDYEFRWTGVYADSPTVINGVNVWEVVSGGSMATLYTANSDPIANHPLNPNPGSSIPFLLRIPFEVWNSTTGEQINLFMRDRVQVYTGSMDVYAFNPTNRMYTYFVNTPYDPLNPIPLNGGDHADHMTWNVVWWDCENLGLGDIVQVTYEGLLTSGDHYAFSTDLTSSEAGELPRHFRLGQNYPNPFNPSTTIRFEIPLDGDVQLELFNIRGQEIRTILKGHRSAGLYQVELDASSLASGLYIYRLQMGSTSLSRKMLFIK